MSRPLTVRKPTAMELRRVHPWLEKPLLSWQRRCAEVLLLHAADLPATGIAQLLQVHPNIVSPSFPGTFGVCRSDPGMVCGLTGHDPDETRSHHAHADR